MTLEGGGDLGVLDAQLRFHQAVGVATIIVSDPGSASQTREVVEPFVRAGVAQLVSVVGTPTAIRDQLRRVALTGQAPDWLIDCGGGEFWWPRGASLKDVLAPIPPRYTIVQGLVRGFVPQAGSAGFSERMTHRRSLLVPGITPDPLDQALRPAFRCAGGEEGEARIDVPLRAWYPIEVFRFPGYPVGGTGRHGQNEEAVEQGVSNGTLVRDERLRDTLRLLSSPEWSGAELNLHVPDIVDDASYAVECAAIGEVDLERLDRHIRQLESRIAWLEQRLWPRVLRRVLRVVGR
jgi:hypothetical protein